MNSENADLQNTRKGDDDAFERLLNQYGPLISSLVSEFSKACPSVDMSEDDLRQEAAIALYLAAIAYKEDKNVSFGLYAKICIKNRLSSYMSRCLARSVSQIVSEFIDGYFDGEQNSAETEAAPADEEPLNILISNESCNELRKNVKALLTENEYKVFILTAEGDTPAEIAVKLGKNVKSVYSALQRIRKKLKKLINK